MRFVTYAVMIIDGSKKKTAIIMIMCCLMTPGWDLVDIDIKQLLIDKRQADQTRFFEGFTVRHLLDIGITVCMPAELNPDIELFVMRQKRPHTRGIQYPG